MEKEGVWRDLLEEEKKKILCQKIKFMPIFTEKTRFHTEKTTNFQWGKEQNCLNLIKKSIFFN